MGRSKDYIPGNFSASVVVTASGRLSNPNQYLGVVIGHNGGGTEIQHIRTATIFFGDPQKLCYIRVRNQALVVPIRAATIVARGGTASIPITVMGYW